MNSSQKPAQMQPVHVSHWENLVWWLFLICLILAVHELPKFMVNLSLPAATSTNTSIETGKEKEDEAFLALVFGKVSASHALAIPATAFAAQLNALQQSGYSSVRLSDIQHWRENDAASLSRKPVLLTFEEANRETLEIADKLLLSLRMTALVFVDTDLLDQANINLVSWHQLELMARSGRWEVGISGCPNSNGEYTDPVLLAERINRQRKSLEHHLQMPVLTADCSRSWHPEQNDGASVWSQGLHLAGLQTGFVAAPFGANYRTDPETNLRRIRVAKSWSQADFLAQLANHAPRREAYSDTFQSTQSATAWVVDTGDIAVDNGHLRLLTMNGEKGALMTLSGTEKWQDAEVEVQLSGQPEGQFWLSLRYGTKQPSVRLGIAEGQIILQEYDSNGVYRQLASQVSPTADNTLKLKMVGARAIAYLNGQALLARPIALPEGADHGAFALAVWNKDGEAETLESGQASAEIVKVSATPLFPKSAILAALPGEEAWNQLRQHSEELTTLSPHYFTWQDSKAQASATNDTTLEIFARFHHLRFSPALFIDSNTPLADRAALSEQALLWVKNPAFDGLNIVINHAMAKEGWRTFLNELNQRVSQTGKSLTVTLLANSTQAFSLSENDPLLLITANGDFLPGGPRLLYPLNLAQSSK
ncbi:hypothetical protein JCM14076_23590 [Methylosoma difficile]